MVFTMQVVEWLGKNSKLNPNYLPTLNAYVPTWTYLGLESAANHDSATCMVFCTTYYIKDLRKHMQISISFFHFLQAIYVSRYMSNLTDKLKVEDDP
jgi:hypothetical protein